MSQENVEVVRAGFEAWNMGDMSAAGKSKSEALEAVGLSEQDAQAHP